MFTLRTFLGARTSTVFFLILVSLSESEMGKSPWDSILKKLNQEPKTRVLPYAYSIDKDLMQVNREELSAIDNEWLKSSEASLPGKNPESLRYKNEFYRQRIEASNAQSLKILQGVEPSEDRDSLAKKVLAEVHKNPTANLEATMAYDPSGQLGFCFGRAMLVHFLLLKAGVKPEDISKIFLAGQLRVSGRMWNFHVAVAVRSGTKFLVVDPLFEAPLEIDDWRGRVLAFDLKAPYPRSRFYVTDARKFLPSGGQYSREALENKHLKAYFDDLRRSMR